MTSDFRFYLDTNVECWYRYVQVRESTGTNEWDESSGYRIRLYCRKYQVIKHTPKGVWLNDHYNLCRKFVLKNARKRFACPTEREALISYIARQKLRVLILENQVKDSQAGLRVADRMLLEFPEAPA